VQAYRAERPKLKARDLIGSEEFNDDIMRLVDAPRYFATPREFREAVERYLTEAARFEDRSLTLPSSG